MSFNGSLEDLSEIERGMDAMVILDFTLPVINGLELHNNQKSEINKDWFLRNPISNETCQNKIFRGRQIYNFNFRILVVLPLYLNE